MVISVDLDVEDRDKLKLLSGDKIEDFMLIVRTQIINSKGRLIKHPGRCRKLSRYTLTNQDNNSIDGIDSHGKYDRFNL